MSRYLMAAAIAALAASAGGQAQAQNFTATGVDIVHAAARLNVITEDRTDIQVDLASSSRLPALQAHMAGDRLVIDGGLDNRIHGCGAWGIVLNSSQASVNVWGVGQVRQEELPTITLRVPRHLDLDAGGAIYGAIGTSAGGKIRLRGCGHMAVGGASGDLDLQQDGSGDADVGVVQGAVHGVLNGSGDLRLGGARSGAQVELRGSGDLTIAQIGGALTARLDGSGDLKVTGGAANTSLNLHGSGDVEVASVSGSLRVDLDGSGDVKVAQLTGGQAELSVQGSGTVTVQAGTAERLAARLDGSGAINFNGRAQVLDADLGGSGDIRVAAAGDTRNIRDHGSGEVHVGS